MPKIARRRFLTLGSVFVSWPTWLATGAAHAAAPQNELTASRFRPLVGTPFEAQAMSGRSSTPLELRLRSVSPVARDIALPLSAVDGERSFVLEFTLEGSKPAQDTFAISHGVLAPFAAFLVPSPGGRTLTAVFNRLT